MKRMDITKRTSIKLGVVVTRTTATLSAILPHIEQTLLEATTSTATTTKIGVAEALVLEGPL